MVLNTSKLPKEAIAALGQFPEFEISSFNDSGANGYVLIGRHNVLKRDVAIKIYFHAENEIDQEPAIISKINHDNVLKVYDARKVEKDCSYFLMPAANEGDLSNYLKNHPIALPLAHKLLCQLLSGISALHGAPNLLVHRDLKPENLLIHDDKIVIADFGSVRRIDNATQKAPASKHSILYRPPEAFGHSAFFDFSSDVYQAGLIGFLLFGGRLTNDLLCYMSQKERDALGEKKDNYDQSSYVDSCIEKRIVTGKIANITELPFYVPNSIKRALKKATSPIGKRYKTVSEFLAELARLRGSLPDWIVDEDGFLLRKWEGNDYLIRSKALDVMKKKSVDTKFRINNSFIGSDIDQIYSSMKQKIGLP